MESAGVRQLREAMVMAKILGFTEREQRFNRASLYYWGRQYEDLLDWSTSGVPLRDKRPNVQIGLTKKAINRVNAHLFGEGHAPAWKIEQADEDALDIALQEVLDESGLRRRYSELGRLGCLHGTVAIGFFVFDNGRIDTEIINAGKSRPIFGRDDRRKAIELDIDFDELLELREYWRTFEDDEESGERLETWHRRDWTTTETVEYLPILGPVTKPEDLKWKRNEEDTTVHSLGFVPAEWITPLEVANDIDGAPIVDEPEYLLEDEVNYTLSQAGRGIRYNQEPTLVLTGVDTQSDTAIKRGGDNTLMIQADPTTGGTQSADAKLLEMVGTGPTTAMDYVRMVRNLFNEIVQVVDHDPAQFAGATSGVALERLLYPMILLVQNLRPDYEEKLGRLLWKMLRATGAGTTGDDIRVSAIWPPVVESTAVDLRDYAAAIIQLYELGIVDRRKAVEFLSPFLDIENVDEFLAGVDLDVVASGTTAAGGALETPAPGGEG
jgi:Phage portal protein, SPP1 Gp6-like